MDLIPGREIGDGLLCADALAIVKRIRCQPHYPSKAWSEVVRDGAIQFGVGSDWTQFL